MVTPNVIELRRHGNPSAIRSSEPAASSRLAGSAETPIGHLGS